MRKLIVISLLIAAAMFACNPSKGQIATLQMSPSQTYVEYSDDVTLTNTTAQYFQVYSQSPWYSAQAYVVNLDSVSGNHTNVAVVLSGRVSDQLGWTTISTTNWAGTTSDTTFVVLNATENQYRQFKILFTGTGTGVTTIDNFEFKVYYGLP